MHSHYKVLWPVLVLTLIKFCLNEQSIFDLIYYSSKVKPLILKSGI